ncbi:MAG: Sec-independent protein translocase protein TatB [Pseudomonadota bacterium]
MSLVPSIGAFELLLVAVIALVVVGPKDLPKLMRGVAGFIRKARELAAEFTAGFEQMAREAEMEEMREEIDRLRRENPLDETKKTFQEAVKPIEDSASDISREANKAGGGA